MLTGLMAGVFWGLDTVILGVAMAMTPFTTTAQAVALAPFVSTFLHDACSSIWLLIYLGVKKQYHNVLAAIRTKGGRFVALGALLGGPVGMSAYLSAINLIGPSYTAIISALYPALGALLSYLFLGERMRPVQIAGLAASIGGVIAMGYSSGQAPAGEMALGLGCALLCCAAWASEGVICAYGMRSCAVNHEHALQIRQLTSALSYGTVILGAMNGWGFTISLIPTKAAVVILTAGLFGTVSYLCYYRAISTIGAAKAMALNITYSAWSIPFALLLLHTLPDIRSIACGLVVVAGSVVAGANPGELLKRDR